MLQIEPDAVAIGPDAIMVPAEYVDRVEQAPERKGFFERVRDWTGRTWNERIHTKGDDKGDDKHHHHHH